MARRLVLVADPDPAAARKVKSALQGFAFEVLRAATFQEAVEASRQGAPAALFCALNLPGGSGYDLSLTLRSSHPHMATVFLCGGFDVLDPARARASGMDGSLRRPLSQEGIVGVLEQLLGALPLEEPVAEPLPVEVEPLPEDPFGPVEVPPVHPRAPLSTSERVATFIPHDYESLPQVTVDPNVINAAMERAILAVLPEALEIVLEKALRDSNSMRGLVSEAVQRAVKEQLPAIARSVIHERMAGDPVPRAPKG